MNIRTIKCTTLAYLPWLDPLGRWATRAARRALRIPHQKSYEIIQRLSPGLYLDVGANNGQSIESIRLFQPEAKIIAFEIHRSLARRIQKRHPDVQVHDFGLGNFDGSATLYVPSFRNYEFTANASLDEVCARRFLARRVKSWAPGTVKALPVQIRMLDALGLNPHFIKIDVEGAERNVVEGALETIGRCRPVLLVEHGENVLDLLSGLDYELIALPGASDTILAPREKAAVFRSGLDARSR